MEGLLYEGKAKKVFKTQNPDQYILYFKDDVTAFNAQKKDTIQGKGILNLKISTLIFKFLAAQGVESHYIQTDSDREILVHHVDIIPLEVVIRNQAAGSLCKRLGMEPKDVINPPLVEFYYKKDELNDPIVTQDHIFLLNLASKAQLAEMRAQALEINDMLKELFSTCDIILADFKLEFGVNRDGQIILADEISPDSCRLWDRTSGKILDKDRFRQGLGGLKQGYQEIYNRLEKHLSICEAV